ncbi:MAG: GTPase [Planctomycetota bacterium]
MSTVSEAGLVHRTHALAITLENLVQGLDAPRVYPISDDDRKGIEQTASDLLIRVRQLQAEPAILTVVFVGGTGVGKSTTLNALAGGKIADAGIARPTTQIPTIYLHRDIHLERLDPIFRKCKTVVHERPELRQKILVDTPDMDGNVREHHDRLREILPVADAVLFIGSQEKYHDREAWKLLLQHRGSRGFAFVLNKWDRCLSTRREETGRSPYDDFKDSLREAGFSSPLVFRTCASHWLMQRLSGQGADEPIDDDFLELEKWIEAGLDERAIRDIKSRGIAGKIDELLHVLDRVTPPDWGPKARILEQEWQRALREGLAEYADLLIEAADKQAAAYERHFGQLGRANFRGIFGMYLGALDRVARLNFSVLPTEGQKDSKLEELAARSVAGIPTLSRDTQRTSLHDHLLALADRRDWPVETLRNFLPEDQTDHLTDATLAEAISSQLLEMEKEYSEPTGTKRATRLAVKALCEWGPPVIIAGIVLKWIYDSLFVEFWSLGSYFGALLFLGLVLGGLHFLLSKVVPVHWIALRAQLRRLMESRLLEQVAPKYLRALADFSGRVRAERSALTSPAEILRDLRDQLRKNENTSKQGVLFSKE